MSFVYDKNINGRIYRCLIEAYRDPETGRPKQRILEYYGRVKVVNGKKVLIPKQSVKPEVEKIIPFGDLALIYDTAMKIDFISTMEMMVPRNGTSAGKSLLLLAINHLTGRIALEDIAEWYGRSALRYWIRDPKEVFSGDALLGVMDSVCKQDDDMLRDKTWLISQAFRRRVENVWGLGSKFVYYDRTQIVYNGPHTWYAEFSYSGSSSKDRRKIGMGVVVRREDGFPVMCQVYRGNSVDVSTVGGIKERLVSAGMTDLIIVMDRGMSSFDNIKSLRDAGYNVIAGVSDNEIVYGKIVSSVTEDEMEKAENSQITSSGVIFASERIIDGMKYVVYQNPNTRSENIASLMKAIDGAKERLDAFTIKHRGRKTDVGKLLNGLGVYFHWSIAGNTLKWSLKNEEVEKAIRRIGRSVLLCTDVHLQKSEIIRVYMEKDEVEKVWRVGKGSLGFNAIKHWRRDRVVSYLFVCYLSYLLWISIRMRLREAKFDLSPDKALSIMKRIEMVRFSSSGREYNEFPKAVGIEEKLQKRLGISYLKDSVMVK